MELSSPIQSFPRCCQRPPVRICIFEQDKLVCAECAHRCSDSGHQLALPPAYAVRHRHILRVLLTRVSQSKANTTLDDTKSSSDDRLEEVRSFVKESTALDLLQRFHSLHHELQAMLPRPDGMTIDYSRVQATQTMLYLEGVASATGCEVEVQIQEVARGTNLTAAQVSSWNRAQMLSIQAIPNADIHGLCGIPLTNLDPGTQYTVRARLTGDQKWTNSYHFCTLESPLKNCINRTTDILCCFCFC